MRTVLGVLQVFMMLCSLAVWAFGAYQMYHNRIDLAGLMLFLMYTGRIYTRLESMSRMVQATQRAGLPSA